MQIQHDELFLQKLMSMEGLTVALTVEIEQYKCFLNAN